MAKNVEATAEVLSYVGHRIYLSEFAEGLKPAQWIALRYFSRVNPMAATLTDFARQVGCTKGTASRTVSHLVRRGLIKPRVNVEDRRSKFLEVTAKGKKLIEKDPILDLEKNLARLSEEEHEAVQRILLQLLSGAFTKK